MQKSKKGIPQIRNLGVEGRKRLAAEQPVPRASCPGCLADLRPDPARAQAGWCPECFPRRDEILRQLLRVPDPHWKLPEWVRQEEDALEGLYAEAEHLSARAEAARRHHAQKTAEMRYRLARERVCLDCHAGQAGYSALCPPCETAWKQREAEQIKRTRRPNRKGQRPPDPRRKGF